MTDQEIAGLGPAFSAYLGRYRPCFLQHRTAAHFDNYCRGLLSDLPRKTVEPLALACGTAVRSLQEFLVTAHWDHRLARELFESQLASHLANLPADALGTVGVIDETSCLKKGNHTPGVQRQYLGCVGKIDNGIVTVHVGVARGTFQALLSAELYLPKSWDQDRDRCKAAGIPDDVTYKPKWQIALDQLLRLHHHGVRFDWLTFDEGYGSKVPFLLILNLVQQRFVAEVPVSFAVAVQNGAASQRADEVLSQEDAKHGNCYRLKRRTLGEQRWRATSQLVWVEGEKFTLIVAINEATGEVKYLVSNAAKESLGRLLQVAFRRATIEHCFRIAKQEGGLMHYEGRQYVGLQRHLQLSLIVLGFVALHTERLRGEKSTGDSGAGMSGVERALRGNPASTTAEVGQQAGGGSHPLPPAAQRTSGTLPQEAAA